MASDDSDDADDGAAMQAQLSHMLGPVTSKMKKTTKRMDKLEDAMESLKLVGDKMVPELRKSMLEGSSEAAAKLERVQAELAQCASKLGVEVLRQEQTASAQALRAVQDEQRGKVAAQELIIQGLEARVAAMENASRATELKVTGELGAVQAQLSQVTAALERSRGETEAKLSEMSARAASQYDGLMTRLSQVEEERQQLQAMLASKTEVAEVRRACVLCLQACHLLASPAA